VRERPPSSSDSQRFHSSVYDGWVGRVGAALAQLVMSAFGCDHVLLEYEKGISTRLLQILTNP
jgi:hypothetical protein